MSKFALERRLRDRSSILRRQQPDTDSTRRLDEPPAGRLPDERTQYMRAKLARFFATATVAFLAVGLMGVVQAEPAEAAPTWYSCGTYKDSWWPDIIGGRTKLKLRNMNVLGVQLTVTYGNQRRDLVLLPFQSYEIELEHNYFGPFSGDFRKISPYFSWDSQSDVVFVSTEFFVTGSGSCTRPITRSKSCETPGWWNTATYVRLRSANTQHYYRLKYVTADWKTGKNRYGPERNFYYRFNGQTYWIPLGLVADRETFSVPKFHTTRSMVGFKNGSKTCNIWMT